MCVERRVCGVAGGELGDEGFLVEAGFDGFFVVGVGGVVEGAAEAGGCHFGYLWFLDGWRCGGLVGGDG